MTASTGAPRQSIYERVMADPSQRHMYFHTTEAMLRANPDHKDTAVILKVLDEHKVVFLYDPATIHPRPRLDWLGKTSIGLEEITEAAHQISATRPPPGMCRWCSTPF